MLFVCSFVNVVPHSLVRVVGRRQVQTRRAADRSERLRHMRLFRRQNRVPGKLSGRQSGLPANQRPGQRHLLRPNRLR